MAKTKNNVQMPAGIRNKLMAAVAMLMISCVMLITSTYAWFTLSTAPEVTNIDTQVTGNGSLEIALMPTTGDLTAIKSGKGTSNSVTEPDTANRSWGNLVDLDDPAYGLESITLMPTKFAGDDALAKDNILNTAKYGTDGRIIEVKGTTVTKSYVENDFTGSDYGVRAIGEENAGASLNDFASYGYVIDLAMRTNSSNTDGSDVNLLLQTEGIQRIYNGSDGKTASTDDNTKGEGTTFSLPSTNGVSLDLLKAIRFTFVENLGNGKEGVILTNLGTAKLNIPEDATTVSTNKYSLCIINETSVDGNYNLTTLKKNEAKQISVVVWIDGSEVDSADFATEGTTLEGSLNLQFSTDAVLYPAQNTKLKNTAD